MYRQFFWALFAGAMLFAGSLQGTAQQRPGEVAGFLSFAAHKYSGEFTDDLWGFGGFASLQYAPMRRLMLEGRVGVGEIKWGITPSDLMRYPDYFGQGGIVGNTYPGTNTKIESQNESRISTFDLLMNYVIVDRIAAVPFITVGIGLVNFSPATSQQHEALPNNASGLYSTSAFSIPLGGGVRIPFSERVGLLLRGEHRFVFTQYLDDVAKNGSNDGITSVSVGLTYAFTPGVKGKRHYYNHGPCRDCDDEGKYDDDYYDHGKPKTDREHTEPGGERPETRHEADTTGKGAQPSDSGAGSTLDSSTAKPEHRDTIPDVVSPTPKAGPQPKVLPQAQAEIKPCPPGTERICVSDNESVCAVEITPGAERIRWEDAFVYEPGQVFDKKTVRQTDQQSPCYSIVVRQTANSYYMCVECCFEKTTVSGAVQYMKLNEGVVVKGSGTFNPMNTPDCVNVVRQGR